MQDYVDKIICVAHVICKNQFGNIKFANLPACIIEGTDLPMGTMEKCFIESMFHLQKYNKSILNFMMNLCLCQ